MENQDRYLIRASEYDTPSEGVVTAVSEITGRAPDDLPILYETVDPDGLNVMVEAGVESVEFEYAGFTVVVDSETVRLSSQTSGDGIRAD